MVTKRDIQGWQKILLFIPGGQTLAFWLQNLQTYAPMFGVQFGGSEDSDESDITIESPTYGFGQWRNPKKGDAVIPVIYTAQDEGHKHAPVYVQAYTTPKGEYDDDFVKVLKARGQGFAALLAVAEGPIQSIDDIHVNDSPAVQHFLDFEVKPAPNGSRTVWHIGKRRIDKDSVRVKVDGVLKGWKTTTRTLAIRGLGSTIVRKYTFDDPISSDTNIVIGVNNSATPIDKEDETTIRPHVWMSNEYTLWVNTQVPLATNALITLTVPFRTADGLQIWTNNGQTTLRFDTAPASGTVITVDFNRRRFAGLRVDWRNGADHQLPLPGFDSQRNSYGNGDELIQNSDIEFSTTDKVDNILIDIASGVAGFTRYDDEGDRARVEAQFRIEVKRTTASLNGDNVFDNWTTIPDPAGATSGSSGNTNRAKRADEFEVRGDAISQLYWSFSIRGLLDKYVKNNRNGAAGIRRRADFTRAKYDVRLRRSNTVKADTNALWVDQIYLNTYDEIVDEWLTYPGVALLSVQGVASAKLQGSAPNITCHVRGKRDVEKWDGSAWVASETAQGNAVWAVIDLVTSIRFGSGEQYTHANIDTTSAKLAADWLDETVTLGDGSTETRSQLDIILDTRKSPIQWATDMLRPRRVWPVLQGNTWRFVIDKAVTLADVLVIYEDGTTSTADSSTFKVAHDSVTQKPTELQVAFLDHEEDYDRREVWVAPGSPTANRRVQRTDAFGVVRRSEATRFGTLTYEQLRAAEMSLRVSFTPGQIDLEAGDVFRFISTRMSLDAYYRVARIAFSTRDYFLQAECIPYVLSVYGQQSAPIPVRTSGLAAEMRHNVAAVVTTSPPTRGGITKNRGRTRVGRMPVRVRRKGA